MSTKYNITKTKNRSKLN